jgi:hypothetical protein
MAQGEQIAELLRCAMNAPIKQSYRIFQPRWAFLLAKTP